MNKWDIVLLTYPFSDLSATKVRPALVISPSSYNQSSQDAVFILITTNTTRRSQYDIVVAKPHTEFSLTGLRYDSAIRTDKIFVLHKKCDDDPGAMRPAIAARSGEAVAPILGIARRSTAAEALGVGRSVMSNHSTALVQKLWNYCNILCDDGLCYGDYVEQVYPERRSSQPVRTSAHGLYGTALAEQGCVIRRGTGSSKGYTLAMTGTK